MPVASESTMPSMLASRVRIGSDKNAVDAYHDFGFHLEGITDKTLSVTIGVNH